MKITVKLENDNDELVVQLPNGNEVSLLLSDGDDAALPELDMMFNQILTANLFKSKLKPSVPYKNAANSLDFVQAIVPLNKFDGT